LRFKTTRDNKFPLDKIFYLGNDINNIECMKLVGCAIAVADAHPLVLKLANIVLSNPGGRGAVRELAERILETNKKHLYE
jgi:3-deoxy-D-manno-octulosonate 8-phosphate phosphatase KdsC-like HAD superfamily phosphatase